MPRHNRRVRVRSIPPGETLAAQRGEVVICIPVYGAHEHFVNCLRSVLQHTSGRVRILVCDDASPDPRTQAHVLGLGAPEPGSEPSRDGLDLIYMRRTENVGFPANMNGAFASAAPADVVILNSDCLVAAGWLEGLRDAAYSDSTFATATALTNHGTIVSVPDPGIPRPELPIPWRLDAAAAALRDGALRLRPRLITAIGHCVFIRRSALELVGDFDLAFSPGYGEEVDFSQRCLHAGLIHVAADEVLVFHRSGASFAVDPRRGLVQAQHEQMLAVRYPYYHAAVTSSQEDVAGPLARSLSAARRVLKGLHVIIDARVPVGQMAGTQLHVLELIAAITRTGEARVTALVAPEVSGYAQRMLQALCGVEPVIVAAGSSAAALDRADVFHRPFQITSPADLLLAAQLGERLILTQPDLVAYRNPSYFPSFTGWEDYQRLTRTALAVADRVVFFSAHARDDALAEDLIEPDRTDVVPIGLDHSITRTNSPPVAPREAIGLPSDVPILLCLGPGFRHKNRVFALRVLEQLQLGHDWPGYLVLAGPPVDHGSSTDDEVKLLSSRPRLARAVLDVGEVSEAEKEWLLNRAALVLYPTVHEGFGLVPFEAAQHEVPSLWAPGTSLSEILPDAAAEIIPWDAAATAQRALELMGSEPVRASNISAIRHAAAGLTWDVTAQRLLAIYRQTCERSASPAGALARRYGGIRESGLSDDAMRLLGPNGAIPAELERPLLALATHRRVGAPVFEAIKLGYRLSYRLRRRGSADRGRPARH